MTRTWLVRNLQTTDWPGLAHVLVLAEAVLVLDPRGPRNGAIGRLEPPEHQHAVDGAAGVVLERMDRPSSRVRARAGAQHERG